MQRVVRESCAYYASLRELDGKVELIRKHFPPSLASLYALPKEGVDRLLEWWSPLGGQPIPYHQLQPAQQSLLLQKFAQRQQSLQLLIAELERREQPERAQTLRSLLGDPELNNLYSINDDPVLVRWGPPAPPIPPPAQPQITAPRGQSPRPVVVVTPCRRWLWPFSVLLLVLLGGLLWSLWWQPSGKVQILSHACRPAGSEPPEFVTIFDTSGSMVLNLKTSPEDEEWFFKTSHKISGDHDRTRKILATPSRMEVAQDALSGMINGLHPDIDTRLITFAGCERQPDHGQFSAAQRPALLERIRGLEPGDGTPLAASLTYAANQVNGRDKDAVIVMFIDGKDGCGGDVCAVAESISRKQPRLRVNVVDIGNAGASSCIATHTGGRVYSSTEVEKVSSMLIQAAQEVSEAVVCD